jgi:hypothetical protein
MLYSPGDGESSGIDGEPESELGAPTGSSDGRIGRRRPNMFGDGFSTFRVVRRRMDSRSESEAAFDTGDTTTETTVDVRCTGHVRRAVGTPRLTFTFAGTTLREFLLAFFAEYDVEGILIAETEADATTRGWATVPGELPGTWRKHTREWRSTERSTSTSTGCLPTWRTGTALHSCIRSSTVAKPVRVGRTADVPTADGRPRTCSRRRSNGGGFTGCRLRTA